MNYLDGSLTCVSTWFTKGPVPLCRVVDMTVRPIMPCGYDGTSHYAVDVTVRPIMPYAVDMTVRPIMPWM